MTQALYARWLNRDDLVVLLILWGCRGHDVNHKLNAFVWSICLNILLLFRTRIIHGGDECDVWVTRIIQ